MKYETLRRVKMAGKRKVGKNPKAKDVSGSKEVVVGIGCSTTIVKGTCVGCGCVLNGSNCSAGSRMSHMCKNCDMVEMAEIVAEDMHEDSLTEAERVAEFLGCSLDEAEKRLAKQRLAYS